MSDIQRAKSILAQELKTHLEHCNTLRYEVNDREKGLIYVIQVTAVESQDIAKHRQTPAGYKQGITYG